MGFKSNNINIINKTEEPLTNNNELEASELSLLLNLIKQSHFIGENVEIIYNMVLKLQNQYIQKTK